MLPQSKHRPHPTRTSVRSSRPSRRRQAGIVALLPLLLFLLPLPGRMPLDHKMPLGYKTSTAGVWSLPRFHTRAAPDPYPPHSPTIPSFHRRSHRVVLGRELTLMNIGSLEGRKPNESQTPGYMHVVSGAPPPHQGLRVAGITIQSRRDTCSPITTAVRIEGK